MPAVIDAGETPVSFRRPGSEIGTVLGHTQLSTTTRFAHHAPERLVSLASGFTQS